MSETQLTNNDQDLACANHNLIYSFLQKYNLPIDEYYGLAAIGLCKAAKTFCGNKASFSTYAYKCMFTSTFCEIRKEKRQKTIPKQNIVSYEAKISDMDDFSLSDTLSSSEDMEDEIITKTIIRDYLAASSDRNKKIILLALQGYKQREIEEKVGISQAHVSRILRSFADYIREKQESFYL